ncbi:hypothetical protein FA13DRAFT_174897 [Coprinellus micaceus]|uniref:Uncharacterized protein n=1 Tax=Coprinellus micaceus TaxID=71717 RepID=A0A4Y7SGR3_COPMI|nr:hypothetical protein FA13DRAFT_174897 [Coprinellus micaceus]
MWRTWGLFTRTRLGVAMFRLSDIGGGTSGVDVRVYASAGRGNKDFLGDRQRCGRWPYLYLAYWSYHIAPYGSLVHTTHRDRQPLSSGGSLATSTTGLLIALLRLLVERLSLVEPPSRALAWSSNLNSRCARAPRRPGHPVCI